MFVGATGAATSSRWVAIGVISRRPTTTVATPAAIVGGDPTICWAPVRSIRRDGRLAATMVVTNSTYLDLDQGTKGGLYLHSS